MPIATPSMRVLAGVLALLAAFLVAHAASAPAAADDARFGYKWPCVPGNACYLTQLDHPTDAWDIDPQGSAGLGTIVSVSEGRFVGYFTQDPVCTAKSSLGRYAVVEDIHGRTLRYSHLSSFGNLQPNQRVLQGDAIGVEGNTGSTSGCAPHLHLSGIATISYIDGRAKSSLIDEPNTPYSSSNSVVGDFSPSGAAIRTKFAALGTSSTSWGAAGWTVDRTGRQNGCDSSFPLCRLYAHYFHDPLVGHWGMRQDFQEHADAAGNEFGSIMAARWTENALRTAFWVQPAYYAAFLAGGQVGETTTHFRISLPLMDQIGNYPGLCEAQTGCRSYQRFHLGYIWDDNGTIRAHYCPDIGPYYPAPDYRVTVGDIAQFARQFGATDTKPPFAAWANSWRDLDGDGVLSTGDMLRMVAGFGAVCYPT